MNRGKLLIVEGPDGLGKTTLTDNLALELNNSGRETVKFSFPGKQSGTLGRLVYRIHHNPKEFKIRSISETSRQLLHIAAHIDLIERQILPSLSKGINVILDRFWWSALVYGIVNGVEKNVLKKMLDVEHSVWNEIVPDLAILLKRQEPFVHRPEVSCWEQLSREYILLAESEKIKYSVEILDLDKHSDRYSRRILKKFVGPSGSK